MFVRNNKTGLIYSASPLEDAVALIHLDEFANVGSRAEAMIISSDEFCSNYIRISPVQARDEYRILSATSIIGGHRRELQVTIRA